ncbi:MAG: glycosyltransferase [Pseudomonadota bacterium]
MTEQKPVVIPALSVVIPVTERHDDLTTLIDEYHAVLSPVIGEIDYTVVFDGHYPKGRQQVEAAAAAGLPIKIFQLARSFGEANALSIGFENSDAPVLMTLPAYRQVESEDLAQLLASLDEQDMIIARRWPRQDSALNQWMTRTFHRLIKGITRYDFRDLGCGVRLLKRRVAEEVHLYGDQHRFLPMLAANRGLAVEEKSIRQSTSESRVRVYAPVVYFRRFLDIVTVFFLTRFTKKPLRLFGIVGGSLFILGGLILSLIVVQRLFFGVELGDRPALVITTLMIVLGAQLFALGLVGELVIFANAKADKEYAIAERINLPADASE